MRACGCRRRCPACRCVETMQADYEKARVRLEQERKALLETPFMRQMREWALEDPRNAKTWRTALDALGLSE